MTIATGALAGALTVRRWTTAEWLARESLCATLARRADCDELFLSWEWLTHWWRCYGAMLAATTEILACYEQDELVGLAPLFRRRLLRNAVFSIHSLQLIGLSWRDAGPLISEYLDVIAPADKRPAVRRACLHYLAARGDWSEFVVGFTTAASAWREAFAAEAATGAHYLRELDQCVSYQADLSAGFAAYLRDLNQSTRRSVWNLRRRLAALGEVAVETVAPADVADAFADLNRLHLLRWGKTAFAGVRLGFHVSLAQQLASRGELALSRLRVGGRVVSVLYDIRKSRRQYNIKMGFDPNLSGQISLGYIHLGFAMEAAAEQGIPCYDFLAGPGRSSDFKRLLSQVRQPLSSVQMVRGRALPALYRLRDQLRR